jgi:hypothetical protein
MPMDLEEPTVESFMAAVQGYTDTYLLQVMYACERSTEDFFNPYNANFPNGPTMWDWYFAVVDQVHQRWPQRNEPSEEEIMDHS